MFLGGTGVGEDCREERVGAVVRPRGLGWG